MLLDNPRVKEGESVGLLDDPEVNRGESVMLLDNPEVSRAMRSGLMKPQKI